MFPTTTRRWTRPALAVIVTLAFLVPVGWYAVGRPSDGVGDVASATPAAAPAAAQQKTGFGVFYVNGKQHVSNWSDNRSSKGKLPTEGLTTTYDQAKVTFLVPEHPTGPSVVLVPGYGLSADIWLTTPDRRMGWAQLLYDAGYPVYVLSPPDRGESMPVDQINKCKSRYWTAKKCKGQAPQAYYGQIGHATLEDSWPTWRFGPKYGKPYADSQFPSLPLGANYIEQFGASFVPYLGTSDIAMVNNTVMNNLTSDALAALLAEIGPSVVVVHSAAGTSGYAVAQSDPELVKAVIAIETTKCPADVDGVSPLAATPFLGIWGDHISSDPDAPGGHWVRRKSCQEMAASIRATGEAPAQVITLPNRGIYGNSHMMMEDRNNQQVLGIITDWLAAHGV